MVKKSNLLLTGVFVVILLLMHFCNGPTIQNNGTFIESKVEIDTIFVKGISDTIHFHDTVPKYVYVEVTTPVFDTVRNINIYDNSYEDSLIDGWIHSEVDGTLLWQNITYTPKFPKYITRVDTLRITKDSTTTITIREEVKRKIYAGFELGGNANSFTASPTISLLDKRDNEFSYRYDIINKTHNIGFRKKLIFRRRNKN